MKQQRTILIIIICGFFLFKSNIPFSESKTHDKLDFEKLLVKAKFAKGYIYHAGDSIETEILIYNRKEKYRSFLYCISKLTNDSIVAFTPEKIDGYRINNDKYVKHVSQGKTFFIQQRTTGRIDLYSRGVIPSDSRFLYYLKFPNENDFIVISSTEKNVSIITTSDGRNKPIDIYHSNQIDDRFKMFISIYMSDCQKIVNMVNTGFYTISDVPGIVDEYNSCFTKM